MFTTYQAKILRLSHQILVGNQPNLDRNQHFRLFYAELPIGNEKCLVLASLISCHYKFFL